MSQTPIRFAVVGDNVLIQRADGEGDTLLATLAEWREFIAGIRDGDFDLLEEER